MLDKLGPPFAFSLWVSARLLLVHGSAIAHTLSPDIYLFVDTLAQMGRYWKIAERYSTILKRVLDEYGEYEQTGGTEGERATPSTVKILADMRRCAFDLDFLISRQPRNRGHGHGHSGNGGAGGGSGSSDPHGSAATMYQPAALADSHIPSPMMTRSLTNNEFEYLDVFGFFNVPRVPNMPTSLSALGMAAATTTTTTNTTTTTTTDNENNNTNNRNNTNDNSSITNPMSIHGITAGTAGSNEFNITNYLIPTPETDWLFPQPHG